jgi:hypothetical protein
VDARVVGRVDAQLCGRQFLGIGRDSLLQLNRVVDRGVDPERHPTAQAVVDHRRDQGAVVRRLRLALDHRGDGEHLIRRQVQIVRAASLGRAEPLAKGDQLVGHQPADGRPGVQRIGGRK